MKTFITVGLSVGAVGAMVAGGLAVSSFLSGGGTQPEEVLPSTTIGFAKLDLDPSAGQKLNALALMRKFPDVKDEGEDLKATLVKSLLDEAGLDLKYEADVEPWLGDRAAVAVVPSDRSEDGVIPLIALEFTDEEAMVAALDKVEAQVRTELDELTAKPGTAPDGSTSVEGDAGPGEPTVEESEQVPLPSSGPDEEYVAQPVPEEPFAYAIRENYVLLSEHQADVDEAAEAAQVLSNHRSFAADKAVIDGDEQIMLGWVNVGAAYDVVPEDDKAELAETFGSARPAGRLVVGVHVESDAVEAVGRTIDLEAAGTKALATGGAGTGLVKDLPANASVAFAATGLGDMAADFWERFGSEPLLDMTEEADAMGLSLPDDLVALLGQEAAAGLVIDADEDSEFAPTARVLTEDADRALEVIGLFADTTAESLHAEPAPGGYAIGWNPDDVADASNGDMGLGDNPVFANAVPGADDASVLLYVNIPDLVEGLDRAFGNHNTGGASGSDGSEREEPLPLQAFGVTATGEAGNGEFTARLTFR